jgi:hypothetical protein
MTLVLSARSAQVSRMDDARLYDRLSELERKIADCRIEIAGLQPTAPRVDRLDDRVRALESEGLASRIGRIERQLDSLSETLIRIALTSGDREAPREPPDR